MTVSEEMQCFARQYGRTVVVDGVSWRYYRLGEGTPVLWLTGGLRRAALGFGFMLRLATRHTVLAPDYPPVRTIDAFNRAFDVIRQAEGVGVFALGGQSYGGLLAQAYLAHNPWPVQRLILSSTGPASYGRAWLLVEYAAITLARVLPEKTVKNLLAGGLFKVFTLPEAERAQWRQALDELMARELSRADVISHFAVAADLIRWRRVTRAAYQNWPGRVVVLSARNDPTQSPRDIPQYEQLFGRPMQVIDMGDMGHTAALFDPAGYVALLEQALA